MILNMEKRYKDKYIENIQQLRKELNEVEVKDEELQNVLNTTKLDQIKQETNLFGVMNLYNV